MNVHIHIFNIAMDVYKFFDIYTNILIVFLFIVWEISRAAVAEMHMFGMLDCNGYYMTNAS